MLQIAGAGKCISVHGVGRVSSTKGHACRLVERHGVREASWWETGLLLVIFVLMARARERHLLRLGGGSEHGTASVAGGGIRAGHGRLRDEGGFGFHGIGRRVGQLVEIEEGVKIGIVGGIEVGKRGGRRGGSGGQLP